MGPYADMVKTVVLLGLKEHVPSYLSHSTGSLQLLGMLTAITSFSPTARHLFTSIAHCDLALLHQ